MNKVLILLSHCSVLTTGMIRSTSNLILDSNPAVPKHRQNLIFSPVAHYLSFVVIQGIALIHKFY